MNEHYTQVVVLLFLREGTEAGFPLNDTLYQYHWANLPPIIMIMIKRFNDKVYLIIIIFILYNDDIMMSIS